MPATKEISSVPWLQPIVELDLRREYPEAVKLAGYHPNTVGRQLTQLAAELFYGSGLSAPERAARLSILDNGERNDAVNAEAAAERSLELGTPGEAVLLLNGHIPDSAAHEIKLPSNVKALPNELARLLIKDVESAARANDRGSRKRGLCARPWSAWRYDECGYRDAYEVDRFRLGGGAITDAILSTSAA